jgi:drug/metabolite transporter superfamily protein YnfA
MEPTNILPIVAVFLLPAVEYGGWALLTAYTGRLPAGELADWQKQFWRAGHAHAGVLLVLSLVYLLYLPRAEFSNTWEWILGIVLLVGLLCQSGVFPAPSCQPARQAPRPARSSPEVAPCSSPPRSSRSPSG